MAKKNNIRSIRFSDELAELIDRQAGRTFTEKFENLVTRCAWEQPQKEEEIKRIQKEIDCKRKELADLSKIKDKLWQMEHTIKTAQNYIEIIERDCQSASNTD